MVGTSPSHVTPSSASTRVGGVQVVDDVRDLQTGGGLTGAVADRGHREGALQRLGDVDVLGDAQRGVAGQVRVLLGQLGRQVRGQPLELDGLPAVHPTRDELEPAVGRGVQRVRRGVVLDVPGDDALGEPDGLLGRQVTRLGRPGLDGQQVALLARQDPHLVPDPDEVEALVGGQVLLVALVEDVAERRGPLGERDLEGHAEPVGGHRLQRLRPLRLLRGTGPDVQAPEVGEVVARSRRSPRRDGCSGGRRGRAPPRGSRTASRHRRPRRPRPGRRARTSGRDPGPSRHPCG